MRRIILAILSLFFFAAAYAGAEAPTRVYVIPIDDEIGSFTWQYLRHGLERARESDADMIVIRLNTYGGAVDAADSIRTALLRCPEPTVAFIDNNAASAGALIALACDSVFMRPDATMGAATVVNGADGTAMPDKYQSYMRAMMRATAQSHGRVPSGQNDSADTRWRRDPLIAEAMVDHRVVVPGLIDSTKVLTFTASEAVKWGYAEGYASNVDEIMTKLDVADYEIETDSHGWLEDIIGWLTHPAVRAVLISLIMLGIYWEIQMPGTGLPAAVALTGAVIYFLPAFFGHAMSPWIAILFAIGVILIIFEVLVIPGFGIAGIAGIVAIAASLFWGLLDSSDPLDTGITMTMVWSSVAWFTGAVVVTVLLAFWLTSEHGPRWIRRHTELDRALETDQGYIGVDMSMARHVGSEGIAATDLRPGGKVDIDGERYDAVSLDGYIEAGTPVRVRRHANAQLYVARIS